MFLFNKCIEDDTKAAAPEAKTSSEKNKNNKIRWRAIFNMADGILSPCNVARGMGSWIRQVAAPCNVAPGSRMTCHWIRQNVLHIRILLPVSILIMSPQSTCHSVPVCEILSKSWRMEFFLPTAEKWRHVDFQDDFTGPMMGSYKSPCTTSNRSPIETIPLNCLVFEKIVILHFGDKIQDGGSVPAAASSWRQETGESASR